MTRIHFAYVVVVAGLIALTTVGCQKPIAIANAKVIPSATPIEAVATPKQVMNTMAGITQEEAGIKIRVDMPEIRTFLEKSKQGPVIPALKQNAIPQGMAYLEEKNWLLVTHYREDGKPSIISVIDEKSGEMLKALEIFKNETTPYTGHAGGVAVSNKYIWISSEGNAYYFPKDDLLQADKTGKIVFKGAVQTDTRASFNAFADGILWVGEFAQGASYPTDVSHYMTNRDEKEHKAWAVGYKLDPSTDLPSGSKLQASGPVVPDMIISLPDSVQGMYLDKGSLWLSQSYGRNSISDLTRYKNNLSDKPHTTVKLGQSEVPVWFLDNKNKMEKMEIAPMAEGIFKWKGHMYILFESGATKYKTSTTYALERIYMLPWSD
ncbi:hypothetical protein [Paenibacillus sp. LjRoot56]|uniref:hypothetical protein n=1 Tax=Paenibacillus sp. LjRoot56 TaxID=3342333 RepID=UPI003ED15051